MLKIRKRLLNFLWHIKWKWILGNLTITKVKGEREKVSNPSNKLMQMDGRDSSETRLLRDKRCRNLWSAMIAYLQMKNEEIAEILFYVS